MATNNDDDDDHHQEEVQSAKRQRTLWSGTLRAAEVRWLYDVCTRAAAASAMPNPRRVTFLAADLLDRYYTTTAAAQLLPHAKRLRAYTAAALLVCAKFDFAPTSLVAPPLNYRAIAASLAETACAYQRARAQGKEWALPYDSDRPPRAITGTGSLGVRAFTMRDAVAACDGAYAAETLRDAELDLLFGVAYSICPLHEYAGGATLQHHLEDVFEDRRIARKTSDPAPPPPPPADVQRAATVVADTMLLAGANWARNNGTKRCVVACLWSAYTTCNVPLPAELERRIAEMGTASLAALVAQAKEDCSGKNT